MSRTVAGRMLRALYRARTGIGYAGAILLTTTVVLRQFLPDGPAKPVLWVGTVVGAALFLLCWLVSMIGARRLTDRRAVTVTAPVRGRWLALNSPATTVPSHGVRAYGQSHAIDLVADPEGGNRPEFGGGPSMRAPEEFPAFGEPVLAMIDGVVVRASDWRRDHRSRSSWAALVYLTLEGIVREAGGPGFVVGNHVVIRGDDGVYAAVAHLRRGSITVAVGERVSAGQRLGACGNSGNSTEPHVHAQLMDRASFWTGRGIPFEFREAPVPANGEHLSI